MIRKSRIIIGTIDMNIRKHYKIHAIVSGVVVIMTFAFNWVAPDNALLLVGSIAFVWFAFVMLRYHRCPHCRKYLPLFDFKSTNCRYCGSSLDEPESAWYVCPKCGKSNRRFDMNKREIRYCGYCGCPLNKNTR